MLCLNRWVTLANYSEDELVTCNQEMSEEKAPMNGKAELLWMRSIVASIGLALMVVLTVRLAFFF